MLRTFALLSCASAFLLTACGDDTATDGLLPEPDLNVGNQPDFLSTKDLSGVDFKPGPPDLLPPPCPCALFWGTGYGCSTFLDGHNATMVMTTNNCTIPGYKTNDNVTLWKCADGVGWTAMSCASSGGMVCKTCPGTCGDVCLSNAKNPDTSCSDASYNNGNASCAGS